MINSESVKKLFGANLRKLRLEKGLTQEQLAECLDLQVQTVSFIENGRAFVSSELFSKICNFLMYRSNLCLNLNLLTKQLKQKH